MKYTFAPKNFAAWSFRCVTLIGPVMLKYFRIDDAQAASAGAAAGQDFHAGTTIGQDYHTGATIGQCNG